MNTLHTLLARGAGADLLRESSPQREPSDPEPAPEFYDGAQFEDERDLRVFSNLTDPADEMGGV
jgi:hypothetical protein